MSTYLVNRDLQPDGTLPTDKWEEVQGNDIYEALQGAIANMDPERLPFTVHLTEKKTALLYPNGCPMITQGFTLEEVGK